MWVGGLSGSRLLWRGPDFFLGPLGAFSLKWSVGMVRVVPLCALGPPKAHSGPMGVGLGWTVGEVRGRTRRCVDSRHFQHQSSYIAQPLPIRPCVEAGRPLRSVHRTGCTPRLLRLLRYRATVASCAPRPASGRVRDPGHKARRPTFDGDARRGAHCGAP